MTKEKFISHHQSKGWKLNDEGSELSKVTSPFGAELYWWLGDEEVDLHQLDADADGFEFFRPIVTAKLDDCFVRDGKINLGSSAVDHGSVLI